MESHLPSLIYDLALILLVGSAAALLFKVIKQPLVLGYIIAGFLVSPHFSFLPSVADLENVETLAELGVIFLLFSLGLEFSFKKLVRVGPTASITAIVEIIFIGISGFLVGKMLGWNDMDSLFLGGMLASSSTTIILRAFDELGVKTKQYAKVVFGILVVEDIIVILLMVLLSTIAVTRHFEGDQILFTVLKLGFFMVLWFLIGIYLLPTFFKKMRRWLDEETTLLLAIGLCLGMVVIATQVGFSAELGAFVMGSLIAETTKAEKIEHITLPIKALFGSIFFVSVGMLIDPQSIVQYALPILFITLLVIGGKFIFSVLGMLLSGQPLRPAVQVGMSMAQIGEFAFIVATLGMSLKVISDFLFPIAVGVSAITTFTTPYLIKASEPFYQWLTRHLPKSWLERIERYSANTSNASSHPIWKRILLHQTKTISINIIIIIAILLCFIYFIAPYMEQYLGNQWYVSYSTLILALICASPFLWAILKGNIFPLSEDETHEALQQKGPFIGIMVTRFILTLILISAFTDRLVSTKIAVYATLPLTVGLLLLFSKRFASLYQNIENRFFDNLSERERAERIREAGIADNPKAQALQKHLDAWDAHIVELEIPPLASYIGKSLQQLNWRDLFGINIIYIKRGDHLIQLPSGSVALQGYDKIGVVATDEQIQLIKPEIERIDTSMCTEEASENFVLKSITLEKNNRLVGKSILHSQLQQEAGSLIIGIERDGTRHINPDASFTMQTGDMIWLAGNESRIKKFFAQPAHTH